MALSREELRDHPPLVMGSRVAGRENAENSDAADPAEPGRDADATSNTTDTMGDPETPDDDEMIDYLVSEDGADLDRENMEPLAGTDCLGDIYQRFNAEANPDEVNSDENPDGGDDSPDEADEPDDKDRENANTYTDQELREKFEEWSEERENARQKESLVEWIDSRSERYNAEKLEGASPELLEEIADDVVDEQRANAAGASADAEMDPSWSDTPRQADRSAMRTDGPMRANAERDNADVDVFGDDPFETPEADD